MLDFTEIKNKVSNAKDVCIKKLKETDLDSAMIGAAGGALAVGLALGISQSVNNGKRNAFNAGWEQGKDFQANYDAHVIVEADKISNALAKKND